MLMISFDGLVFILWLLFVKVKLDESAEYLQTFNNITVQEGFEAIIDCHIENARKYKVSWSKIGHNILADGYNLQTNDNRIGIAFDNWNTWSLRISRVTVNDSGFYLCQAYHDDDVFSFKTFLEITVPPNILDSETSESSVTVNEYDSLVLRCKAVGNPEPRIKWRRENFESFSIDKKHKVKFVDGEQLIFREITRFEMGSFLCIASNKIPPAVSKRFTIDVNFRPQIYTPNQIIGVPIGTNATTIECVSESLPLAEHSWTFENQTLRDSKRHRIVTVANRTRSYSTLAIFRVQKSDYGPYKCSARNSLGKSEDTVTIYEIKTVEMQNNSPDDSETFWNRIEDAANDRRHDDAPGIDNNDRSSFSTPSSSSSPSPSSTLAKNTKTTKYSLSENSDGQQMRENRFAYPLHLFTIIGIRLLFEI